MQSVSESAVRFALYCEFPCWCVGNAVGFVWSKLLQKPVHRFSFRFKLIFVSMCSQHQLPHLPCPAKFFVFSCELNFDAGSSGLDM